MSETRYVIRPKADKDLDDESFYYSSEGNPELGRRFLRYALPTSEASAFSA